MMANPYSHAGSIRCYLTGAASDGAAQSNPDLSLGGFRSSTEAGGLGAIVSNPVRPLVVEYVGGSNRPSTVEIRGHTDDTVYFTAEDGTEGIGVALSDGYTVVLSDDEDHSKFIRIRRDGTSGLFGTMSLKLVDRYNNAIAMSNVPDADRVAGSNKYRALMLKSVGFGALSLGFAITTLGTQRVSDSSQLGASGGGTITTTGSFADWPETGWCHIRTSGGTTREIVFYSSRTSTALTVPAGGRARLGTSAAAGAATDTLDSVPGIRWATESPVASAIQTIANESTAPTGVTWKTNLAAEEVDVFFAPSELLGLWLHREIPAGAVVSASVESALSMSFDAA